MEEDSDPFDTKNTHKKWKRTFSASRTYMLSSPDGDDCMKKFLYSTRAAAFLGSYVGAVEVIGISRPKGWYLRLERFLWFAVPITLIGSTYAASTCIVSHVTKKTSAWNHAIGALPTGLLVGAFVPKNPVALGFFSSGLMSLLCGGFAWWARNMKQHETGVHYKSFGPYPYFGPFSPPKVTEPKDY